MLSHILMRQNATRCFGQIFQGAGAQITQTPLMRAVGLTSAMQSISVPHLTTASANSIPAQTQIQQTQRWFATFQQTPINLTSQSIRIRTMSSNHPKIWAAEKIVSLILVPGLIVPFIWTTPLTDAIFCTLRY